MDVDFSGQGVQDQCESKVQNSVKQKLYKIHEEYLKIKQKRVETKSRRKVKKSPRELRNKRSEQKFNWRKVELVPVSPPGCLHNLDQCPDSVIPIYSILAH